MPGSSEWRPVGANAPTRSTRAVSSVSLEAGSITSRVISNLVRGSGSAVDTGRPTRARWRQSPGCLLLLPALPEARSRNRPDGRSEGQPQSDGRKHRGDIAERSNADVGGYRAAEEHQHPGAEEERRPGCHEFWNVPHRPSFSAPSAVLTSVSSEPIEAARADRHSSRAPCERLRPALPAAVERSLPSRGQ